MCSGSVSVVCCVMSSVIFMCYVCHQGLCCKHEEGSCLFSAFSILICSLICFKDWVELKYNKIVIVDYP